MKIFGFYHIGVIGRWQSIVDEQLARIQSSGLYAKTEKIFTGFSGGEVNLALPKKFEKVVHDSHIANGEVATLQHLYKYCQNLDSAKIWYIHTKGASHVADFEVAQSTEAWRKYLEYFIIDQHEACMKLLEKYDVVSAEWRQCVFAGNFWWARSNHIKNLPNPLQNQRMETRYRAEADFITLGNPRMKNIMTLIEPSANGECLYHKKWSPEMYENLKFDGEDFK